MIKQLIEKATEASDANEALTWAKAAHHAAMAMEAESKAKAANAHAEWTKSKTPSPGIDFEA